MSSADLSTLIVKVGWLLPELPPSVISVEGPSGRILFNCVTGQGEYEIESERRPLSFRPASPEWERQYDAFATAIDRGYAVSATVNEARTPAFEVTTAGELSASRGSRISRTELYRHTAVHPLDTSQSPAAQIRNSLSV